MRQSAEPLAVGATQGGVSPLILGQTTSIDNNVNVIERMVNGTKTSFYHTNTGFQLNNLASGKATQSDFFDATASKLHEQSSQVAFNE